MWDKNNQSITSGDGSINLQAARDINLFTASFPSALVDKKIDEEVSILRKSRFFIGFDGVRAAIALGRQLVEGELSGGTDAVRCQALAWCARILSRTDELDEAENYLRLAKSLGACPEIEFADALISSQRGDKSAALKTLARISSPASLSAAFMVVAHHDGGGAALSWLRNVRKEITDLDADGKFFLLTWQLKLAHWEPARGGLDKINERDLEDAPVLHYILAMTQLLSVVPVEFRAVVQNQLPFQAADFPLASDATSMAARRTAHQHFCDAAVAAQQLKLYGAAAVCDEYALWLELKDPENSDKGRQQLEARLRDTASALRLVPLALQFGVKLDFAVVQQEIERQIALNGGITQDAAAARFALAFTQKTPEAVANYVALHYEDLSKYFDKKAMQFLQIEMFSQAGLLERANECLDLLLAEGLSEVEESRLRRIISEAEGADPIEARKAQFKQSDSLSDLAALVDELDHRKDWNELCEYGALLFERTRSVRDAERLANALSKADKADLVVKFLKTNPDQLLQSKTLQMFYCWALYHEGALLEARSELTKLSDDQDNPNYRALQLNLGIALGDWGSLSAFVANEYVERDRRSAHDLMGAAQLALHLNSIHAKELIFSAAAKAGDQAAILAAAYFLASSAGWEGDSEVGKWLHTAAELSGDDGPIQKMTLKDVLDRKPDWDRRESETWQSLARGEIPIFLAARSLNKSLVDLTLFPALANLSESDPRRRSAIPAYSGKRLPVLLNFSGITVGMDATALLTLSFLDLIDKALDAFDAVHVPHSTLAWLFEEKQKAAFHQPSRIGDAHQIRDLLARDILEKLVPSSVADSGLSAQVGDDLALLISEAEKVREDDDTQRIVVRSAPVHRLSSLMEEEADLSGHSAVMCSCLPVVEKLREKGQITGEEEKRARAYLQLHEKPWPNQPIISDGAVLYLDDLAITYFLHLGVLEKLHAAGLRAIASPRAVSEADALISYEGISDRVNLAIERIRGAINSRIESGKIKVGRRFNSDEPEAQSLSDHPTFGVIALASSCDVIISDDRLLNQHGHVDDGKLQAPILSTLDVLDALASANAISAEDLLEHRTLLRRAGYFFMPVTDDELAQNLNASTVKNGKVIETAELKAIRESILRVRMSDWLQLPKEAPWLDTTLKVFIKALKKLWTSVSDLSETTARSNWILDQADLRGWAHSFGPENGDNVVRIGRGALILPLLLSPFDAPPEIEGAYWGWVESEILGPIKEQFPDLYAWIVEWQRIQVSEMAEMALTKEKTA
ncbi:MAG: hypothetical protein ROZ09_00170 [Thiobacillus sp.]|uniref:HTH domain-containing protein n=1 Tax=Thiobacillus sp. TaxID=924 RepID=UPI002895073C|nr:hypothetical protein [Thiobacillus sp.]MDT3705209.1 hypothetical protein [Thiobacillus sp.]